MALPSHLGLDQPPLCRPNAGPDSLRPDYIEAQSYYNRLQKTTKRVRIYEVIVEPGREEHLARHGVSVDEAEEVVFGEHLALRTRQRRYALVGQTATGRYLKVIVAPRGGGVYGLVTALDASEAERRLYRRHTGR